MVREISTANPDIVRAYVGFSAANAKSTHLDAKTRELIALGVAVSLRCDGCINAHTDAALKAGASKEEIIDALGGQRWFIQRGRSMPMMLKPVTKAEYRTREHPV